MKPKKGRKPIPGAAADPDSAAACREHREDMLDDALAGTFPASDPPAVTAPPSRRCD